MPARRPLLLAAPWLLASLAAQAAEGGPRARLQPGRPPEPWRARLASDPAEGLPVLLLECGGERFRLPAPGGMAALEGRLAVAGRELLLAGFG